MYKISPFTPLFFNPSDDLFGIRSKYIQKFAPTDQIFIEIIAFSEKDEPVGSVVNTITGTRISKTWNSWKMNDSIVLYYCVVTGLANGYYEFELNGKSSELFEVTDDERKLSRTTLIQYSMRDNKQRTDCVFIIEGKQYLFDFRVPGGFKDSGWGFGVTNEQFVSTEEDVFDLYSSENTIKTFTLGNAEGCPVWYAELLNRIMSCSYVFFNGKRFVRNESSVPEMNQISETVNSYVFTLSLMTVQNTDKIKFDNQFVNGGQGSDWTEGGSNASFKLSKNIIVTAPQTGHIKTGDVILQGTTYEDIFVTMLAKKASAKLSGILSTSKEVEYGTSKGYISYTAVRNGQGAMKKAYYDNNEANILTFSKEVDGIQTATRQLSGIYTQKETYIATVEYDASADGSLTEIKLNDSISVNVRRKWFAGICTSVPKASNDVRALQSSGLYTGPGTYKFPVDKWKMFVICIPTDTIKDLTLTAYPGNFIEDRGGCSGPIEISVEGANNSEAIKYKMWIVQSIMVNDSDTFTFKTA